MTIYMYIKKIYQNGMNGKKKARHLLRMSGFFYSIKNVCFSCESNNRNHTKGDVIMKSEAKRIAEMITVHIFLSKIGGQPFVYDGGIRCIYKNNVMDVAFIDDNIITIHNAHKLDNGYRVFDSVIVDTNTTFSIDEIIEKCEKNPLRPLQMERIKEAIDHGLPF